MPSKFFAASHLDQSAAHQAVAAIRIVAALRAVRSKTDQTVLCIGIGYRAKRHKSLLAQNRHIVNAEPHRRIANDNVVMRASSRATH